MAADRPRTILITGAAGNLGSLLARHLLPRADRLRLMYHCTPLPEDLVQAPNVEPIQADLGDPRTLPATLSGVAVVVHFAAGTRAPFTRDFIRIGRVSHWGDTSRAREELIPELLYPTLASGRPTL